MPALILSQTGTTADNGFNVGCSGATGGSTTAAREATDGGSSGGEVTIDPGGNDLVRACLTFQSDVGEPGLSSWDDGQWVVRLNITTAEAGSFWVATYICERDGDGNYYTVTSLTGQTDETTATTLTHTVPAKGSTHTTQGTDSTIYIVCVFQADDHGGTIIGITMDQDIDTPIQIATTAQQEARNTIIRMAADQPNIRM